MPPYSAVTTPVSMTLDPQGSFEATFGQQHESSAVRMGDVKKAQLATLEQSASVLPSSAKPPIDAPNPAATCRLNVKTHVFKKEQQEYVPTQIEDRLRIETIIYVELSIVNILDGDVVRDFDYLRIPKDLFFSQPDKIMSAGDLASKRILDVTASLQCPSSNWQEEKEACIRCARRMSSKLEQSESRILHLLPELHRDDNGDALISFRSGVANIQFKVNCYCGHKKEKEGFVVRFDSQSDDSIASHVTLPLMFYHQNKNRVAARAAKALAKAQAKAEQQQLKQQQKQERARNVVKSATSKTKREPKNIGNRAGNPLQQPGGYHQHYIPSPPDSTASCSSSDYSVSPVLGDFVDRISDTRSMLVTGPSGAMTSLFPELPDESSPSSPLQLQHQHQQQQQQPAPMALISHMTPSTGPTRGGTLVTIHGSGFTVGEMMYVCFGETFVPIIPQRDHMVECFTPAWTKAETVPVFALHSTVQHNMPVQTTFTYVDDNERELVKLALQRMMNISARMDGPVDSVLNRANEFAMWSDILEGSSSAVTSEQASQSSFVNLENMVLNSFKTLDTPMAMNLEGLSIANSTGHTMLHLSVLLEFGALAKDLIRRDMDIHLRDKNGCTALDIAYRLGSRELIAILAPFSRPSKSDDVEMDKVDDAASVCQNVIPAKLDTTANGVNSLPNPAVDQSLSPPQTTLLSKQADISPARNRVIKDRAALSDQSKGLTMDFEWTALPGDRGTKNVLSAIPFEDERQSQSQRASMQSTSLQHTLQIDSDVQRDVIDGEGLLDMRIIGSVVLPPPSGVQNHRRLLFPEGDRSNVLENVMEPVHVQDVRMVAARVEDRAGHGVVVAGRRSCDGVGARQGGAPEQAVIQSSRDDVESESMLFLGGMPVPVSPRGSTRAALSEPRMQQHTRQQEEELSSSALGDNDDDEADEDQTIVSA
ncbi:SPT3 Dosage dependent suppressor of Ty-induced promoter mutations-like protein [Mortierella alpina]|uniref:SPT3 Dosage dependent suppressor of Ty-induced promoter mutations-like protein n=1 Tax=Mortierella alpina TaxID=64518 RepID=A0A9P6JAR8_MORAP|nr:SPT3 Dosage dependent suppressor of Ty-induced promoter mutations-like protein [Mortierella alpina]